jgi:hypothetical protein
MKIAFKIMRMPDGLLRGVCPALPGCVAYGRSNEEMAGRMEEAVRGYLASLDAPGVVGIGGAAPEAELLVAEHAASGLAIS